MSRLIKKSVSIVSGVTISENGGFLSVMGPKGELKVRIVRGAKVRIDGANFWVEAESGASTKSAAGTLWSIVKNAVQGVSEGFLKVLEIEGVGFRAALEGKDLMLYLGYVEPVRVKIPNGATITIEKNMIKISGIDKDLVGRVAAGIRALKKPEPYKGKGIHYQGEVIRRKVGKKAGATAVA